MKILNKRILSVFLSAALFLNVTAVTGYSAEEPEAEPRVIYSVAETEIIEAVTSAPVFSFFALDANGNIPLKSGNYADWIDRIEFPDYAENLYNTLSAESFWTTETNFTSDGTYGQSIEVKTSDATEIHNFVGIKLTDITVTCDSSSDDPNSSEKIIEAEKYIYAAYDALDRDHPEICWLTGQRQVKMFGTGVLNDDNSVSWTISLYFVLVDETDGFDVRSGYYTDISEIEFIIDYIDECITEIKNTVTGTTDYEKITEINNWLTENNEYNTSSDLDSIDNSCRECSSALVGNTDTDGPVCEGYARAFKVLCDSYGIPCVLVDGNATNSSGNTEAHMWNYVQLDNAWYAVDVTWNDPVVSGITGALSGYERTDYLAVGSSTEIGGSAFIDSHPVSNTAHENGTGFTNGPVLSTTAYTPAAVVECTAHVDEDSDTLCDNCEEQLVAYIYDFDDATYTGTYTYYTDIDDAFADCTDTENNILYVITDVTLSDNLSLSVPLDLWLEGNTITVADGKSVSTSDDLWIHNGTITGNTAGGLLNGCIMFESGEITVTNTNADGYAVATSTDAYNDIFLNGTYSLTLNGKKADVLFKEACPIYFNSPTDLGDEVITFDIAESVFADDFTVAEYTALEDTDTFKINPANFEYVGANSGYELKHTFTSYDWYSEQSLVLYKPCTDHETFTEGVCDECGYECPHDNYTDGECDVCGLQCEHDSYTNSVCDNCGAACKHTTVTDGKCTVCEAEFVASVSHPSETTVYYTDLAAAAQNCPRNGTVTLLADVVTETAISFDNNIATLDMNGHSISSTTGILNAVIGVQQYGELTLKGEGTITNSDYNAIIVSNGTLNLGGTVPALNGVKSDIIVYGNLINITDELTVSGGDTYDIYYYNEGVYTGSFATWTDYANEIPESVLSAFTCRTPYEVYSTQNMAGGTELAIGEFVEITAYGKTYKCLVSDEQLNPVFSGNSWDDQAFPTTVFGYDGADDTTFVICDGENKTVVLSGNTSDMNFDGSAVNNIVLIGENTGAINLVGSESDSSVSFTITGDGSASALKIGADIAGVTIDKDVTINGTITAASAVSVTNNGTIKAVDETAVTGTGLTFSGNGDFIFTSHPDAYKVFTLSDNAEFVYDGTDKTDEVKAAITLIDSYTLPYLGAEWSLETDIDDWTITVTDEEGTVVTPVDAADYKLSFTKGTVGGSLDFTVQRADIADMDITAENYIYCGSEYDADITIKNGTTELIANVDYLIEGDLTATNKGTYTVVISGISNYQGKTEVEWTISALQVTSILDLLNGDNTHFAASKTYDGSAVYEVENPEDYYVVFTTADDDVTSEYKLDENCKITVTFEDAKAGIEKDYSYIIEFSDEFAADFGITAPMTGSPDELNGTINPKLLDSVTIIPANTQQTYTGSAITPSVTVKDGEYVIDSSQYDVSYFDNVMVGEATITVISTENSNYSFTDNTSFTIVPASIADVEFVVKDLVYGGYEQGIEFVSATFNGISVNEYEFDYENSVRYATDAGEYKVVINGIENFTGTTDVVWTIEKFAPVSVNHISDADTLVEFAPCKTYDGTNTMTAENVFVQFEDNNGKNAEIVLDDESSVTVTFDDANAGQNKDFVITIKLSEALAKNLTVSEFTVASDDYLYSGSIMPKSLESVTIIPEKTEYTYTGEEIKPSVTVKDGDTVIPADQYMVKYLNNIAAGIATICVENIPDGNYVFYGEITFEILTAKATVSAAPTANKLTYNGADQNLVAAGTANGGTMVYSLTEDGTYSETIPTGKNAGTYIVYYYVQSDDNHYDSEIGSVSVTIEKANPDYIVPTDVTAVYGDTLADVTLPVGFAFEDALTTSVGNAGANTFKVKYTPTDSDNYNTATGIELTVTVKKAPAAAPTAPVASEITYGQKLSVSALTEGWKWENGNVISPVNNSGYNAYMIPDDTDNYDYSNVEGFNSVDGRITVKVSVTVNPAALTLKADDRYIAAGDDLPAVSDLSYTSIGIVEGDELDTPPTLGYSGADNMTMGEYDIVISGAEDENYTITYENGTLYVGECAHTGTMTVKYDADSHWYYCEKCKADNLSKSTHAGGTATCSEKAVCTTCKQAYGNIDSTNHDISDSWAYDTDGHWYGCGCGEKFSYDIHSGGTATCTEQAVCATCKIPYGTTLGHSWKTEWTNNSTHHWHECKNTGCTVTDISLMDGYAAHSFGEWVTVTPETETTDGLAKRTCICGYAEKKTIPATGSDTPAVTTSVTEEPPVSTTSPSVTTPPYTGRPSWSTNPAVTTTVTTTTSVTTTTLPPEDDEIIEDDIYEDDDTDDEVDAIEPQIKGDNGKMGWDAIEDEILETSDGDKVIVDMNGATEVPEEIFEAIRGMDIDLVIELDNGFIWTINGVDVFEPTTLDLGVEFGSDIPLKIFNYITGEIYCVSITLAYEGEFGLTAVLSVDLGEENAGYYANLYYYDGEELEFICVDKISSKGIAELTFMHASEYIIVIDDSDHSIPDYENSVDEDNNPFTAVTISFTGVIVSAAAVMLTKKRRK